jgi:hypothetical protein
MITDLLIVNENNIQKCLIHSQDLLALYMDMNRLMLEISLAQARPKRCERDMIELTIKRYQFELVKHDFQEFLKKMDVQ